MLRNAHPDKEWPDGPYLIVDYNGDGHLPIRHAGSRTDNHSLMGAAHAALLSPSGFRGQRYDGPRRDEAVARLRTAYQQAELKWPDQK